MFESKGYEEFSDLEKYGEPLLTKLLDWVIYKVGCFISSTVSFF